MEDQAIESKDFQMPTQLFRYRSLDTIYIWEEIERALKSCEIFLPSAAKVNDPFEFSPILVESSLKDLNLDIKRTLRGKPPLSRARVEQLTNRLISRNEFRVFNKKFRSPLNVAKVEHYAAREGLRKLREKARLACFCETPDSIPMWAHYASHRGVCLAFDVDFNSLKTVPEFLTLPVKYAELRPTVSTLDLRVFTLRSKPNIDDEVVRDRVFDSLFFSKAQDWAYEREWRVVETSDTPPRYEKIEGLKLKALLFGIEADNVNVQKGMDEFGSRISVFKATPSRSRYGVDFTKVAGA